MLRPSLFVPCLFAWLGLNVARLLVIDAGPALHFEHVRAAAALFHEGVPRLDLALLAGVLGVGLALLVALRRTLLAAAKAAYLRLGPLRSLIALAALAATAAFPSREPLAFGVELLLSLGLRLSLAAALVALVLAAPASLREALSARVTAWLEPSGEPGVLSRLPLACAALSLCVSAVLAVTSYERMPHVPDEVAYLFQARYFAQGALSTRAPAVPEAFEAYLITCEKERCFSPFPPGWPAVLALGVLGGAPWLVNPLLGALNVLLIFAVARKLFDLRTARLATLLFALSPWHLLISMSFMSHTFSLTCALLAALCVQRVREGGSALWCLLGGAGIGLVSLSRPLEAVVVAGVLGVAALWPYERKLRLLPVILLGAATLAVALVNLPYNEAITGDAKVFPVSKYMDDYWGHGKNDLGFGPSRDITWNGLDPFPGHGLRDVIVNSQLCTTLIHNELFGWGFGSLWPVLALCLLGLVQKKDLWPLAWIALVVLTQALYWFSGGPDFGARYWYTAIAPLVLLSARALLQLDELFARPSCSRAFTGVALFLCASALVVFVPWRAIDKYHHYRKLQPGLRALLDENHFGRSLVIVRGENHPDWVSALNEAPLDPSAPNEPVIFWGKDRETERLLHLAYPHRRLIFVAGPSLANGEYRIVPR